MTKKQAIESLRVARQEMKADPDLEEVDTLAVMEGAIADAWKYLTSKQAKDQKPDVAGMIADMLDGKEWGVETLDEIADVLRAAGYQVRDVDGQCPDCEEGESTYCGSFCDSCLEQHCEECDVCAKDFS